MTKIVISAKQEADFKWYSSCTIFEGAVPQHEDGDVSFDTKNEADENMLKIIKQRPWVGIEIQIT